MKVYALLLFLCLAALFLVINRGAYRGYFQDDDLDNLSLSHDIDHPGKDIYARILLPKYYQSNYRPTGHAFYKLMSTLAGMKFEWYIAAIQMLHLLNVALVYLLLRRLGFTLGPAWAGALLFALNMACFDVYWKAMYVFDLLCGTLCLLSLLAYVSNRWIVSLILMMAAFHAKEIAIMLPVVLAGYEYLIAGRRWKRLIPFFALSLTLGVQALINNFSRTEDAYTLHFDADNVWTCIRFYAGKVFLIPLAGLLVFALPLIRDRRATFGLVCFCVLLIPMLLLSGRLFSAYLYVPLIGLAIGMAAIAATQSTVVIAIFFLLWLPWNFVNMRWQRRVTLADARDRRAFVHDLTEFAQRNGEIHSFIGHASQPVNHYGTAAVIKLARRAGEPLVYAQMDSPEMQRALNQLPLAILKWDWRTHQLQALERRADTPDVPYIRMGPLAPLWQLKTGWYEEDHNYRWVQGEATATLSRPADARQFELVVTVNPELLEQVKQSHVSVSLNGKTAGEAVFSRPAVTTVRWEIPPGTADPVEVTFRVWPLYQRTRSLGIAIVSFGFYAKSNSSTL